MIKTWGSPFTSSMGVIGLIRFAFLGCARPVEKNTIIKNVEKR
jgi:hypothetical protein